MDVWRLGLAVSRPALRPLLLLALVASSTATGFSQEPAQPAPVAVIALDSRLEIIPFATSPQIVTPTGIDVDHRGRIFAIESNTHFRPAEYPGHPTDRLLMFQDRDGDGRAEDPTVVADGFVHAMSVLVRPDGNIYVATRREIVVLRDSDGDNVADERRTIVRLETEGNYPHNGLGGFAHDALDWLYFGFGENLGEPFKLIGSDGSTVTGPEGGQMYRCRMDGSRVELIATGFWNPHASCVDAFGRLFSVDNDPDSRPPCRLLHVIKGGDYGYHFVNGRKGTHPFTSWNGELPGTLPMVAGTGEAPSGIVAYESDGLPQDYIGNLLVTSWGDHRIDRFRPKPSGTSYESILEPIIAGNENFRPVGLAVAPDGSLYCTDWVLRDYNLHRQGRIWRITSKAASKKPAGSKPVDIAGAAAWTKKDFESLRNSPRLDVRRAVARRMFESGTGPEFPPTDFRAEAESRWAMARQTTSEHNFMPEELLVRLQDLTNPETPPLLSVKDLGSGLSSTTIRLDESFDASRKRLFLTRDGARINAGDLTVNGLALIPTGDAFFETALVELWGKVKTPVQEPLPKFDDPVVRFRLARVLRRLGDSKHIEVFLNDADPDVRRYAVQWATEEKRTDLADRVEAALDIAPVTVELFRSVMAAREQLAGKKPDQVEAQLGGSTDWLRAIVLDEAKPAAVRALALRLLPDADSGLSVEQLREFLDASEKSGLPRESLLKLAAMSSSPATEALSQLAHDSAKPRSLQLEAIDLLATLVGDETKRASATTVLTRTLPTTKPLDPQLVISAVRSLRKLTLQSDTKTQATVMGVKPSGEWSEAERDELSQQKALFASEIQRKTIAEAASGEHVIRPADLLAWGQHLDNIRGDAERGRRTFFHVAGAGCYKCHKVEGRGGNVGPDLSRIGSSRNREQLLHSILYPSREIAPQFATWTFELNSGKTVSGMIVSENEGKLIVGDADGTQIELKTQDVSNRQSGAASIMPENLFDRITPQEFADILSYLQSLQ